MKILMICDFFNPNQLYQENQLTKYYKKKGHEVVIIASKYISVIDYYEEKDLKKINPSITIIDDVKIIRLNYYLNFFNKVRLLSRLSENLISENPDVVYIHGSPLSLMCVSSYKIKNTKTKIIFDSHADFSNSGTNWISLIFLHKIFYRSILKYYLNSIDKFFYITPRGGEFISKIYGIPKNRMLLLPLGADIDYINKIKTQYCRENIRKSLGVKSDGFIVFTGGKLRPIKKIELIIDAINSLGNDKIHLIIIGKSTDTSYYKKLLEFTNKNFNIHFLGWLDTEEIYKYLYASEMAVFPSSPSVLWQQSIASGLPVIIGDEFGNANYLNKNNNAFILTESSLTSIEISSLIQQLFENDEKYKKMKSGALKTAGEFLSYDLIASQSINFNN